MAALCQNEGSGLLSKLSREFLSRGTRTVSLIKKILPAAGVFKEEPFVERTHAMPKKKGHATNLLHSFQIHVCRPNIDKNRPEATTN